MFRNILLFKAATFFELFILFRRPTNATPNKLMISFFKEVAQACFAFIKGGKKGFIGIWDMRHTQRQIHFFKAHDHPIKCLAIDPNEEFIVTGAVDGDIKVSKRSSLFWTFSHNVKYAINISEYIPKALFASYLQIWSLSNYKCHYTFTGEHSRHGIFKNISQGVSQVMVDEHK